MLHNQNYLLNPPRKTNQKVELANNQLFSGISTSNKRTSFLPNQTAPDQLEQRLHQLIVETSKHLPYSIERQQGLTQIVRMILKSGKLWKDYSSYYEDALQQTWLYFCRNLCEATTGEKYDPNRGSVITWLNAYLKRRLQDAWIQEQATITKATLPIQFEVDLLETVPATPDIPPILETTREWVEKDPNGELRSICIQGHPHVTCQVLIKRRLPPETDWKTLATEFNVALSTLTSFYRRHCLPRLRKFGELQGYLEITNY